MFYKNISFKMGNNQNQVKKKLLKLLSTKDLDSTKLLELTNEFIKSDEEYIRFSVDAGVINRLGKELVARHETAVSELIKNAYDADATLVNLFFEDTDKVKGKLTVEDNGTGMSREQLINGFMRISSTDKIHNPVSIKFKRSRAGKKGIGRFATQRLGSLLTIITQTSKSSNALRLKINWEEFELDKDLNFIKNKIEEIPKISKEGTTLVIEYLRDIWTEAQIRRVFRYSSELFQPFPLSKKYKNNKIDPGFKSFFFKKESGLQKEIINEDTMFFNYALADIQASVSSKGLGSYAIKSKNLNIDETHKISSNEERFKAFKYLKNINFKAYYFIYDQNLIPKQIFQYIREVGREKGGIKLYRNGFRIPPYGEKNNDWLGLDESSAKRSLLAPHANNNYFGFVEILDKDSKFQELASREGFLKDEIFEELVSFINTVLLETARKISQYRKRKSSSGQKDWKKIQKISDKLRAIAVGTNNIADNNNSSDLSDQLFLIADENERFEKEILDENSMLRVLAGLGLTMAEFIHEIKNYVTSFGTDIENINRFLEDSKPVHKIIERLRFSYNSFYSYTGYFDKVIAENIQRNVRPIEIRDPIGDFLEVVKADTKKAHIEIEGPLYEGYDLYTTPMHPSEWASILFNLYTNSKKAIKKAMSKGKILIKGGRDGEFIYLEFLDNGIGIPQKYQDRIFDAFFTTTSQKGQNLSYHEEILGTGLGLKIVKDIISSYGGNILVKDSPKGFKTCIRIELPVATKIDMSNYEI